MQAQTLALAGSRSISSHPAITPVVQAALASGASLSVGCCVGADALVIGAVLAAGGAQRLSVFAQFAQGWGAVGAAGTCSLSAHWAVQAAAAAGARVAWLAGGPLSLPLAARLIRRSQAVVASASALVLFAPGAGSLSVAAFAIAQAKHVLAFGALPAPVPGCVGAWAPSSLFGLPCWAWQPAQASLL